MCSNKSKSSGAGFCGDGGDATQILKKSKRQRIPKRGPGVAELEKILREQETSNVINLPDLHDKPGNNVSFVSDPLHRHNIINHFSPPPPPPPPPPPSQMSMVYCHSTDSKNTFSGGGGSTCKVNGVRISGSSALILPEESFLPTVWNSCEPQIYEEATKMPAGYPFSTSFANDSDHQIHLLQHNQTHHHPSPTINFFPQYGPEHTRPAAGGIYVHHVELPSIQSSSSSYLNYSSVLPADQQMVGSKRPRIVSTENTTARPAAPVSECQSAAASASHSPFAHTHMHTPDHPPPFNNHTPGRTGYNIPRYTQETLPRGDYAAMSDHFLTFGSPETPFSFSTRTTRQDFHNYHPLPFQGISIDGPRSKPNPHEKKKPFYSFLIAEEEQTRDDETTLCLSSERPRRDDASIDLNLKL